MADKKDERTTSEKTRAAQKETLRTAAAGAGAGRAPLAYPAGADPKEAAKGGDTSGGVITNELEQKELDELKAIAASEGDSPRGRAAAAEIAALTGSSVKRVERTEDGEIILTGETLSAEERSKLPIVLATSIDLAPSEEHKYGRRLPAGVPLEDVKDDLDDETIESCVAAGSIRRATPVEAAVIAQQRESGELGKKLTAARMQRLGLKAGKKK